MFYAAEMAKKAKKRKAKKTSKKSVKPVISGYEEVEFTCANCGKHVKMIKVTGYSTEGLLCQRCGQGEDISDDD